MARKSKKVEQVEVEQVSVEQEVELTYPEQELDFTEQEQVEEQAEQVEEQAEQVAEPAPKAKGMTAAEAKAANLEAGKVVAKAGKGLNTKRQRVYGYNNPATAGVNKEATITVVSEALPRGVSASQWELLCNTLGTVAHAKDSGVTARTIRRAFRAGSISLTA